MNYLSNLIIPIMVLGVVIYAIRKKTNVYDTFIDGAKESFEMIIEMFPCLLAMLLGINILLKSDILNVTLEFIKPVLSFIKVPLEIIPMAIMRPISGTSALAILNTIFIDYGPDSFIGRLASVIQGSTDTTLYVLTLYFGSIGIKKIKYALWAGLLSDVLSIIVSIIIVNLLF